MKALGLLVLAALLLGTGAPHAWAQSPEAQVEQGLSEFQDLEFAQAIATLETVVSASQATPSQRLLALELIGISHLSLGNEKRAERAFERLLELRPDYELRNHDGSPKVSAVFETVRKRIERSKPEPDKPKKRPTASEPLLLSWQAPSNARAGKKLTVGVVANGAPPLEMRLYWKTDAASAYADVPMRRYKGIRWRARVKLPKSEEDYGVSYYVEAFGPAGEMQGRLGSATEPARHDVQGRGGAQTVTGTPWYRSWKVWAGVGAATFLGGSIAILNSGSDLREGNLSPGRITLSP